MTSDQIQKWLHMLEDIQISLEHAACNPQSMTDDVGATVQVMQDSLRLAWLDALSEESK